MNNLNQIQALIIQNIKNIRQSVSLSQGRLADKANITRGYLAEIETGKAIPSLKTLVKLSNALGIRMCRLFLTDEDLRECYKADLVNNINEKLKTMFREQIAKIIDNL